MGEPVLSSIRSHWEVVDQTTCESESEEPTKAYPYKKRMSGIESDVIARDISVGFCEAVCRQEFLDGEMRELDNLLRMLVSDYDDQI